MRTGYISVFLILIIVCAFCGCTDFSSNGTDSTGQQPAISVETRNYTLSELKEFVQNATEYAKEAGIDQAALEFNDLDGKFIDGTLYIYALDYNGTYIAQPFNQALVGRNEIENIDANGMRFVEACRDVAESGGGYILYTYPNPSDSMKSGEKIGYVSPVNDEWWIGSGIYLDDLVDEKGETPGELAYVQEFVKNASSYAESVPMADAIAEFSNESGVFYDGTRMKVAYPMYVIAIDYEGNVLAHPSHDVIGENIFDGEGKYGVKNVKRAVDIARNGGGFLIYGYDSSSGVLQQNLNYVMPVEKDDYCIISSGIYRSDLTPDYISLI